MGRDHADGLPRRRPPPLAVGSRDVRAGGGDDCSLYVNFVGSKHRVTLDGCYKFHSVRETDGEKVDGWVQMGQQARGSGCPF